MNAFSRALMALAILGYGLPLMGQNKPLVTVGRQTPRLSAGNVLSAPAGVSTIKGSLLPAKQTCANLLLYGGDNTFTSDNSAAFAAAVAAAPTPGQVCIYAPAGHYKFTAQQTVNLPVSYPTASITIRGDGPDITSFDFSSGTNGILLQLSTQFQSVHLSNFSVLAGSVSNSTTGISLTQNQVSIVNPANSASNDISYVNVRGNDGYAVANRWGYGIDIFGASNVNLISVNVAGSAGSYATNAVCIRAGGTSAIIPVVLNMTGVTANYCGVGFSYGSYLQGVTISQSNFTGDAVGIDVPAGGLELDQLAVSLSQFNNNVAAMNVQSTVAGIEMFGNHIYIAGKATPAIQINNAALYSIVGNVVIGIGTANNGVVISDYNSTSGIISGNTFYRLQTGVWLRSLSQLATVAANSYSAVTAPILNNGTNNIVPVTCSGAPTSSFATTLGIITHC